MSSENVTALASKSCLPRLSPVTLLVLLAALAPAGLIPARLRTRRWLNGVFLSGLNDDRAIAVKKKASQFSWEQFFD